MKIVSVISMVLLTHGILISNMMAMESINNDSMSSKQQGKDECSGVSALQAAVIGDHFDEAARLIKAGADIRARLRTIDNATLLHLAAENGNVRMVDLLRRNGASLCEIDDKGETAVQWAIKRKNRLYEDLSVFEMFIPASKIEIWNQKGRNERMKPILRLETVIGMLQYGDAMPAKFNEEREKPQLTQEELEWLKSGAWRRQ